jgi:hypothetical protein
LGSLDGFVTKSPATKTTTVTHNVAIRKLPKK